MKALTYQRPGQNHLGGERQKPALQQGTDAIVKILKTTICRN